MSAGIARVVYGAADPNPRVNGGGGQALRAAGVEVSGGLLAAESERLMPGSCMRMRAGRPLVRCKIAASLDGRTALADGRSQWITGEAARVDVQRWRAQSCGDPDRYRHGAGRRSLAERARTGRGRGRQPLRVMLDSRLPHAADCAAAGAYPGEVLVFGAGSTDERRAALEARGARVVAVAATEAGGPGRGHAPCSRRCRSTKCWWRPDPMLNGALLAAGLIDELIVYQCGAMCSARLRGACSTCRRCASRRGRPSSLREARRVGEDLRLIYTPLRCRRKGKTDVHGNRAGAGPWSVTTTANRRAGA